MFITSTYMTRPVLPNRTSMPRFFENTNNFISDEVVSIVRKLKRNDLTRSNVIIDLKNKSVIKNRDFSIGKDYDAIYKHFHDMYPQQLDELQKIAND